MSKYRVYQLAKEFNLDTKKVIDILNKNNFKINNNFNLVGEKEREVIATIVNNKENNNKNTVKKNNQQNNQNANQHRNNTSANNNGNKHKNNGTNNKNSNHNNNHNKPNNNAEHKQRNNKNAAMNNNLVNDKNERSERNNERSKNRNNKNNRNQNQNNNRNNNRPNNNKNNNKNNNPSNKFSGNKKNKGKNTKQVQPEVKHQEIIRPKHIKVGETITVKELASKMTYPVTEVIKKLMLLGTMATINQELDFETASLIAEEFGIAVEELPPEVDLTEIPEIEDDPEKLQLRPPVVTVMGHVDHGKTSLLDAIRKTSVTSSEAGGITQHIGAYQVMCNGQKIVFLDTPGHEAFTAMRARGAQVTDIAVLVVAADDGVMPQTLEAINHAKAAKVPIVVAINKIDKPGANPEHVKQQLAEHELIPEEWGGQTIMVPVSAKKKMGINDLLEMILLVAEVQELKANPNREARGVIIEARLDKGRGPVASVLVQNGTLRIGDFIIAGTACGKVRAMVNDRGENVKKAGPSMPVEVLGLSDVPEAGDELAVLDEKLAKTIAEKRIEKQRNELMRSKKVSLDDLFNQINQGDIKELNLLVKADVQGSVEAVCSSLLALNKNESEVRVSIVHSGVGAVTESDVMLASAANALIIAFNVRPDANARKLADTEKIEIHTYRVIYEAIDDIQSAMKGMLAPKYKEVIQGKVEIRQVMKFSKALVAGSYVLEGKVCNNSKIRIIRDNIVLYEGQIESLRRFKDDVKEVASGYECGITIDNYRDFREGDILEVYTMEEIPQK
ncbi:translation initiation factor IF-2 [Megamonas hypermegale]|uniref:Translation initiation factor IF-2 n=1 Tax=Megamonas hypermegale TaxID=158847 RepID=A0A239TLW6_9FIRM|nr:translation initiation factor IF-2 [Megamonas hypermegale]MBM6833313.1 translation initiation factor IF-2 [Megamonas hypermegale]OUO38243.1 translation initiation factor IF-2 [Megamonas hypermegale]SNU97794.1 Translation initiation factor IF-2 [Megamonas hypermegale]HJG08200.1 translation initiation factor IF-2 [Megamonas hypermegale]